MLNDFNQSDCCCSTTEHRRRTEQLGRDRQGRLQRELDVSRVRLSGAQHQVETRRWQQNKHQQNSHRYVHFLLHSIVVLY